jgi:hypothetical protein
LKFRLFKFNFFESIHPSMHPSIHPSIHPLHNTCQHHEEKRVPPSMCPPINHFGPKVTNHLLPRSCLTSIRRGKGCPRATSCSSRSEHSPRSKIQTLSLNETHSSIYRKGASMLDRRGAATDYSTREHVWILAEADDVCPLTNRSC